MFTPSPSGFAVPRYSAFIWTSSGPHLKLHSKVHHSTGASIATGFEQRLTTFLRGTPSHPVGLRPHAVAQTGPAWSRWSTLRLTDLDQAGPVCSAPPGRRLAGWLA